MGCRNAAFGPLNESNCLGLYLQIWCESRFTRKAAQSPQCTVVMCYPWRTIRPYGRDALPSDVHANSHATNPESNFIDRNGDEPTGLSDQPWLLMLAVAVV